MSNSGSKKSSVVSMSSAAASTAAAAVATAVAVATSKTDDFKWLDIFATDEDGNSALMIAIQSNNMDTVNAVLSRARSCNKLHEVLQIVNKDDENAYCLALRAENSSFIRLIEDAAHQIKKSSFRRSRKFLKYKSSESFKATPKKAEMHRPKSEEAVGSASTSDIEPEIDEEFAATKIDREIIFKEMLSKKLSDLPDKDEIRDEKTPKMANVHSDSFTFEHETIEFVPASNSSGIMDSLSGKIRSLMSGRKDDPTKKKSSVTTTQIHFTSMPFEECEVYDGSQNPRFDIDSAISTPPTEKPAKDRVTIAHHHYDELGDNSVCVPPEFSGPQQCKRNASGHTSAAQAIMKPLRNLRSRGQSREDRAKSYKSLSNIEAPTSSSSETSSTTTVSTTATKAQ